MGLSLDITTTYPTSYAIFLSVNATQLAAYGDEAFRLETWSSVNITGKTALAVMEGGYYFLNELGVEWLGKEADVWTVVPATIANLGVIDEIVEPDWDWRYLWGSGSVLNVNASSVPDWKTWAQRNRLFGAQDYYTAHSYGLILSNATGSTASALWDLYPDWFLPDDVYTWAWELNPLNATVLEMSTNYTRTKFDADSLHSLNLPYTIHLASVPVTPNDSGDFFPPYSSAWADSDNITDDVFALVADVADNISADYPGKYVSCYVYSRYGDVAAADMPSNIMVQIGTAYYYGDLTLSEQETGWVTKGVLVGLRDYVDIWGWYHDTTVGNPPDVGYQLTRLQQAHNNGLTIYNGELNADSWCGRTGIYAYITAKLLWDSALDVETIVQSYCDKAYGNAGDYMRDYYKYRGTSSANLTNAFSLLNQSLGVTTGLEQTRVYEQCLFSYYLWQYPLIETMSQADLQSFYTNVCKMRDRYIVTFGSDSCVEETLRGQLKSRFSLSDAQVDALQDFVKHTAGEMQAILDAGLEEFT
jgi:hypothetical protein